MLRRENRGVISLCWEQAKAFFILFYLFKNKMLFLTNTNHAISWNEKPNIVLLQVSSLILCATLSVTQCKIEYKSRQRTYTGIEHSNQKRSQTASMQKQNKLVLKKSFYSLHFYFHLKNQKKKPTSKKNNSHNSCATKDGRVQWLRNHGAIKIDEQWLI